MINSIIKHIIFSFLFSLYFISFYSLSLAETYTWTNSPCKGVYYVAQHKDCYGSGIYTTWGVDDSGYIIAKVGGVVSGCTDQGYWDVNVRTYYWSGQYWLSPDTEIHKYLNLGPGTQVTSFSEVTADPCGIKCESEQQQLVEQCGGNEGIAWKWTDKDQCLGECLPPCEEGELLNGFWENGSAEYLCLNNCRYKNNDSVGMCVYEYKEGVRYAVCKHWKIKGLGERCSADEYDKEIVTNPYDNSTVEISDPVDKEDADSNPDENKEDDDVPIPDDAPSSDPNGLGSGGGDSDPVDLSGIEDHLQAIKDSLDSTISQNNSSNDHFYDAKKTLDWIAENNSLLVRNTKSIAEILASKDSLGSSDIPNLSGQIGDAVADSMNGSLDGIKDGIDSLNNDLGDTIDSVGDSIDSLPDNILGDGSSSDLPDGSNYDSTVQPIESQPDLYTKYLETGAAAPYKEAFQGTQLRVSGSNPRASTTLLGKQVTIDVSAGGNESVLNMMGYVLVFVSTLIGLRIIVKG